METAADAEPALNVPKYATMSFLARLVGIGPFVPTVMKIMFGRTFRSDASRTALRESLAGELRANDLTGMRRALHGVIARKPLPASELGKIRAPTLVVSGEEDTAVVPPRSQRLAALIPGAKFVRLPGAGHTASIEQPDAVNRLLAEFWGSMAGANAAAG
jgi:pimeloyl-ACP methyl ester carboxylesterase